MVDAEEDLFTVFQHLFRIADECSCSVFSECGLSDMTVKQVAYLKTIDRQGEITFSRLAELTRTSKPTVTEMINKCARMECVYRERSPDDGRIQYIRLTDKGRAIAQAEEAAMHRVIRRMMESLDANDRDLLVAILQKVR